MRIYCPNYVLSFIIFCFAFVCLKDNANGQSRLYGQVVDTVHCLESNNQTYALYIPQQYDESKKWPVIFFFEPLARGKLPLRKYSAIANELGYILIASNNSKNGSWDIAFNAGDAMFKDAFASYSLDENRIYTAGFSGGARVASAIAVITGKIVGVISCGAGLSSAPQYKPTRESDLDYVSIVGNKDMNYLELQLVEKYLDEIGLPNKRIVYDGIHEWPPSYAFYEALLWIELRAYQRQTIQSLDVQRSFYLVKGRADSLLRSDRLVEAHDTFSELVDNYKGHMETQEIERIISDLASDKQFKKEQRVQKRIEVKERDYQKGLFQLFTSSERNRLLFNPNDSTAKTMEWWLSEIDKLKRMSKRGSLDKQLMMWRSLNLIWARFAESSFRLVGSGDLELAREYVKIWLHAEPDNSWGHWTIAKIYSQMGEVDLMIEHLNKVKKQNPNMSQKSVMNEEIFSKHFQDVRLQKFISELK